MDRTLSSMPTMASLASASHPRPLAASSQPKGAQDYIRAVRRRAWVVLGLFLLVLIPGVSYALRKPPIYRTEAVLKVEPLQNDDALASLLRHRVGGGGGGSGSDPEFIHYCVAILKNKMLATATANNPEIATSKAPNSSPAKEVLGLTARVVPRSNLIELSLEGRDPAWITKLLRTHAEELVKLTDNDHRTALDDTLHKADGNIRELNAELKKLETLLGNALKETNTINPSGESILEKQLIARQDALAQEYAQLRDLEEKFMVERMTPKPRESQGLTRKDAKLEKMYEDLETLVDAANRVKKTARNFDNDPAARRITDQMNSLNKKIDALEAQEDPDRPRGIAKDPIQALIRNRRERIVEIDEEIKRLFERMQEEHPAQRQYLSMLEDRSQKLVALHETKGKYADYALLVQSLKQHSPVEVIQPPQEPDAPVGPNRAMIMIMAGMFGLALGIGVVCLLEHADHSIRRPEALSHDLNIPVYGIVPWVPRTAATDRGGHLWAIGEPTSPAADSFRNLRASLLGSMEPVITLLVTSAKSGEGKTTTALNLAATCARAGERTLLVDVDLRRPSLDHAFPECANGPGLIDILRGELPWQRVIRPTEAAHLDVLPAGDAEGLPVEILGTREMRQLLESLALHYDRVILDGPSVLGMAECRMLGRAADATLFVVRAASQTLTPIRRAKEMLEQSRVRIAGVVLNALREDLRNWSNTEIRAAAVKGLRGRVQEDAGEEESESSEMIVGGARAPWA